MYNTKNMPKWLRIPMLIISLLILIWISAQFRRITDSFGTEDIPPENAVQCDAVITEVIHHTTDSGKSTGTELHIKYTFEGTEYNEKIYAGFTTGSFQVGEVLHMTVDKTNPHYAIVNSESTPVDYFTVMIFVFIGSFILATVGVVLRKAKKML